MKSKNIKPRKFRKPEEPFRVNERIRAPQVRLVGDNVSPGVYTLTEALRIAEREGEDLVEISPTADPPVCKVISYSKFKYDRKKKLKEIGSKTQKTVVKEIRLTPSISSHDLEFKTKHATKFLEEGAKVSIYVQYRGREMYTALKQTGLDRLGELAAKLEPYGKIDEPTKIRGRRATLMIVPHSKKK